MFLNILLLRHVGEGVLQQCVEFFTQFHLKTKAGRQALYKVFVDPGGCDLANVILSAAAEGLAPTYSTHVLNFLHALLKQGEPSLEGIFRHCSVIIINTIFKFQKVTYFDNCRNLPRITR